MCIYKRKYIDLLVYSLTPESGIKKKLIIFFLIIYVFVFYLICIKIKICMQK